MTEQEMIQRWVEAWRIAGPELEAIRQREIREEDTQLSIRLLKPAIDYAIRTCPADLSPGMVEMQRIFQKLRP